MGSLAGASACTQCGAGSYSESIGSSSCACQPGYFSSNVKGSTSAQCVRCSNLVCPVGQFAVPCSSHADAHCANCSPCPVGFYLISCISSMNTSCAACSNKYEYLQCGSQISNYSLSFYIGSGDTGLDDCPWQCVATYYRSGDTCKSCTTTSCAVGLYRTNCTLTSDGNCVSCSKLPENAHFTSSGLPMNVDNCKWECNANFFLQNSSLLCKSCTSIQCQAGEFLAPCTQNTDYRCQACGSKPDHSRYVNGAPCAYECNTGYFQNGSTCLPCSNLVCGQNQRIVNCSSTHDTSCTSCLQDVEYLVEVSGRTECRNCSLVLCNMSGTYLQSCSAVADAKCVACSLGPLNSFYISSGSPDMNNCSWICNAGYVKSMGVCIACLAGKFSQQGDTECFDCPSGKYSSFSAGTSPGVCIVCSVGTYSTESGATSVDICQRCQVGYYQNEAGLTFCDSCPSDQYGISSGATSLSGCLECPSDTSTRGASGQAFAPSCICSTLYYRIDNETVQCQKCPLGLQCTGYADVLPIVNGSQWATIEIAGNNYYRLTFCPQGYSYANLKTVPTSTNAASLLPNQECSPCIAGHECIVPPCDVCSKCSAGFYKECTGPSPCLPCAANTFAPGNGSQVCHACPPGTTTNGETGCLEANKCVCDSQHYVLEDEELGGCLECSAGLKCFGNSTVVPIPLEFGQSDWSVVNSSGKQLLDLTFCPSGYYIAGSVSEPSLLQCTPCAAGFECPAPPCRGACTKCKKGYYKASTILLPSPVPGSTYDTVSGSYVLNWIASPCAPCPLNTYRSIEGGTEVGACTNCPAKSSTNGMNGSILPSDCKCESFYYSQVISASSTLVCADCPQGCVCSSDRSCALGLLTEDSFVVGNVQSDLKCPNPVDNIIGTWKRINTGEYILISCPPGYTMVFSNSSSTIDTCVICPAGSYLLGEVTSPSTTCMKCPLGATCPGGSFVNAQPGYWQASSARRGPQSQAVLYQCPIGYCGYNNTCLDNRIGPVSFYFAFVQMRK